MEDGELALLGRLEGPSVVPIQYVQRCRTYREAVRMSWALRRVKFMTLQQLAAEAGLYHQHVSDYLNPDDKPGRRDLPPEKLQGWNTGVGNTLVTQWLAARDHLTVLEEMQATRAVA